MLLQHQANSLVEKKLKEQIHLVLNNLIKQNRKLKKGTAKKKNSGHPLPIHVLALFPNTNVFSVCKSKGSQQSIFGTMRKVAWQSQILPKGQRLILFKLCYNTKFCFL